MSSRPTLYILDAYSLIFQVFHAIPLMTGPSGQPTNAVFGIFRDLLNLTRTKKPQYLAGAFDGGGPVFRSELYADYKAQRKAMPEDLVPQIDVVRRLFEAFRVPVLIAPGFEADDVIATLAMEGVQRGLDAVLCTADKDARQLIGEHVRIFNLRKNEFMDEAVLRADWGVGPDQVVDLLSLSGDAVDNVPGVPGIGIKTGAKLLAEHGRLDDLLAAAAAGKVPGKKGEALREHAQAAIQARSLIELRRDVPLNLDWQALKYEGPDFVALKSICVECGFHRFLDEIAGSTSDPEVAWDVTGYRTVDTPEALAAFVRKLESEKRFAFDTETTSLDPLNAQVVGYSFAWSQGEAFYLPVRGPIGSRTLDPQATVEALRPILTDPDVEIIGQNLKYDLLVLHRLGLIPEGMLTDTMVLSYLLESGERNHNLDELSRRLLDHTMIPISSLIGKGKNQLTMDLVDVEKVAIYACEDADAAWRLSEILVPRVKQEGLWRLYAELERPLIGVLAGMEARGIKIDVARLRALSEEFAGRLESIKTEIHALAGREFNIGSGPQLRQILFDDLKLPITKKTPKGEPSTDAEVLEELSARHPLPRLIVQYRQLDKLKGTYLDALPALAHADGRIHASFNQVVAATGRLSSSDPNLQNIPIRTEDGRQIRQAFVPEGPGWCLLTADYSQIELRVLAHYSKDPALLKAFAEDRDIHASVASRIFGVAESDVTSAQRRVAKTVNFGVIYGISPYGLATRLGIPQSEAAAFIDAYFREYEGVARFMTQTLEVARETGRVETILGRRRAVSGVKKTDHRNLNLAERVAVNAVIQGSAADLIKKAMLLVDRRLAESRPEAWMLLQIHDELVFEVRESEVNLLAELVRESMSTALALEVPIKVDVAAGPNWLDVETITASSS